MVEATWKYILDLDVWEEEAEEDEVANLDLVVKRYKEKIVVVQFKYETRIYELQLKLQLTTLQEVRDQRENDLKIVMANIFATMVDFGKLLDKIL